MDLEKFKNDFTSPRIKEIIDYLWEKPKHSELLFFKHFVKRRQEINNNPKLIGVGKIKKELHFLLKIGFCKIENGIIEINPNYIPLNQR